MVIRYMQGLKKLVHTYSTPKTIKMVVAKGDGRDGGFQDGVYFSRSVKYNRVNNQERITNLRVRATS